MNFSEIELKVREATNPDEAWGPHGSLMNEIAQATFTYEQYPECMAMVWKRTLKDSSDGENWRRIYKVVLSDEHMHCRVYFSDGSGFTFCNI